MARQRSDKLSQSSRIYTPDHAASDDLQQKYAHTVTPTIMKILPSLGDIKVLSISATLPSPQTDTSRIVTMIRPGREFNMVGDHQSVPGIIGQSKWVAHTRRYARTSWGLTGCPLNVPTYPVSKQLKCLTDSEAGSPIAPTLNWEIIINHIIYTDL